MVASGIILAGGKNTRMGTNKALLCLDQKTIIQQAVGQLRQFCSEVLVVTNQPVQYREFSWAAELKLVEDILPQMGPLSGIHAGLSYSSYFYNFIVACDMPFINWALGQYMVEKAGGLDVLVPRVGEHLQPMHAVYSKQCLQPIEQCINERTFKITAFFPQVRVGYLEEAEVRKFAEVERVFFNVNTQEDYQQALQFGKEV